MRPPVALCQALYENFQLEVICPPVGLDFLSEIGPLSESPSQHLRELRIF